jgi:hypothetical protein
VIIVRYADDLVLGFEHEADARRFLNAMRKRLGEFALSLHPDKTQLIAFGRHAAVDRAKAGLGKPETFDFLGLTFICGRSRRGRLPRQDAVPVRPRGGAAQGDQGGGATKNAPRHCRARAMAMASPSGYRVLCLPCRADQSSHAGGVPVSCH